VVGSLVAVMAGKQQRRWGGLRSGDVIICPVDGVKETVLFNRTGAPQGTRGRRHVRTNRHDHLRLASLLVEIEVKHGE